MTESQQAAEPKRASPARVLWMAMAVAGGISLLYVVLRPAGVPAIQRHPSVGQPLFALNLTPLTGDAAAVNLSDLRGKVVLLNFWGTWCPPCLEEFPYLARVVKDFEDRPNFRPLLVSVPAPDEDQETLRRNTEQLLKASSVRLPIYADDGHNTQRAVSIVSGSPGEFFYPTTLVLDGNGVIRAFIAGYDPAAIGQLRQVLETLLSDKH